MIDAVPGFELYDLSIDVGEKHDVAKKHPEVFARLKRLAERAREELGDHDRIGKGCRFFDGERPTAWREWKPNRQRKKES